MITNNYRIARLVVAIMCAIVAMERPTRAQDEDEPQNQEKAAPQATLVIPVNNLDEWSFRSSGGKDAARARLESILTTRVERIGRQCTLTEVQKRKLLLAGRGDIKRFFDRAELEGDADEPNGLQEILAAMRPLRADPSGEVFGEGSIFSKAFKTTLTAEQFARYEKVARDVARSRHRATIGWVVSSLDTILELSAQEHQQMEALLVEHTRPPRSFGEYDYYGVLFQASNLPETRFKSILSDRQWNMLSKHISESKRLLPTLKAGGFIPDDEVAGAPRSINPPAANQQNKRG
jgi:hypothetical protein